MLFPVLFIFGGAAALLYIVFKDNDRPVPQHEADEPATRGRTGYRKVDAILGELKKASDASGIPLGLLVGWIAKESGGRIDEVTAKYDERGYFQLMPSESKTLGLEHQRLSVDPVYSINAGLALIGKYMKDVDALGVAQRGSSYYWRLVKLCHTMGSGATKKIVERAKAASATKSWEALEDWALDHERELLSATKHSPSKWFPLVDKVYTVGAPFGFGGADVVVGASARFSDIIDPLDCLK